MMLYDTSAEALERAKAGYDLAWGVLDRLETPTVAGGTVAYTGTDETTTLTGPETQNVKPWSNILLQIPSSKMDFSGEGSRDHMSPAEWFSSRQNSSKKRS